MFLLVGLVVGFSDVGLSDVGFSVVGLLWKRVSEAFGEVFDQAGHKSPYTSPTTPALALKKISTGRVKHTHGSWCLERKEHSRVIGGCLKQNMASRRERKREKWRLGQDQENEKLDDTKHAIVESCVLDGEGYVH